MSSLDIHSGGGLFEACAVGDVYAFAGDVDDACGFEFFEAVGGRLAVDA